MKKTLLSIAAVTVIGGTSAYALSENNAETETAELNSQSAEAEQADDTEEVNTAEQNSAQISQEEAVETAQQTVNGTLDEVKLDTEDGLLVYEVELEYQGEDYDIEVDAHTGEITEIDDDLLGTAAEDEMNITLQEAEETALNAFTDAKIAESELTKEEGRFVYEMEIEIKDEDGDVYVDADTGEILHIESDLLPYTKDASSADSTASADKETNTASKNDHSDRITSAQAQEKALAHAGSGHVDDIELEHENGSLMYEVEIEGNGDDVDVYVDAYTGEVVYEDH